MSRLLGEPCDPSSLTAHYRRAGSHAGNHQHHKAQWISSLMMSIITTNMANAGLCPAGPIMLNLWSELSFSWQTDNIHDTHQNYPYITTIILPIIILYPYITTITTIIIIFYIMMSRGSGHKYGFPVRERSHLCLGECPPLSCVPPNPNFENFNNFQPCWQFLTILTIFNNLNNFWQFWQIFEKVWQVWPFL